MSQQALTEFIESLANNPAWAARLRAEVESHEGRDAIEAVARVASDAGYDVEAADAEAFRSNALKALEDGDLDDESLGNVSGGVLLGVVANAIILGGSGAVIGAAATGAVAGTAGVVGGTALLVSKDLRDGITNFFSKW